MSLRDRKAESPNSVDEAFGCPVAESDWGCVGPPRQGYVCGFAAIWIEIVTLLIKSDASEPGVRAGNFAMFESHAEH
jgi:hypothetical protein